MRTWFHIRAAAPHAPHGVFWACGAVRIIRTIRADFRGSARVRTIRAEAGLVQTQLRSYTSCWSTFGVFETPPLYKVNPRRVWGDYCRAAAVLKCWKKCWWRTAKVADHKRQIHKARDTDLGETVVQQYVLCRLKTVEPQDKNYTIFVVC